MGKRYQQAAPASVSVVVLARELFPWLRPGVESEERLADRIRELAGTLGIRVAAVPEWRGHLAVSEQAADRLLAAAEADRRAKSAMITAAEAGEPVPAALSDQELARSGFNSPIVDVSRKRAALLMGGATSEQMANAEVRMAANGL